MLLVVLAAACLAVACLAGCVRGRGATTSGGSGAAVEVTQTGVLPSVEVTSFRGKPLSPITALQENSIAGPQHIDRAKYRLRVDGLVRRPLSLTYDQVLAFRPSFRKVVTLSCVEGWSATLLWEGLRVRDLLASAGVDPSATVVIFHAHDGYTDALPISYLTSRNILLAYRQNGVALTDEWGWPLQVVAEDKWGYKWVKWIERVEVSSNASYRGFWENRGYSVDASLSSGF
jgi:DMSO/TMAO reductase YedYZ molybdopterin-dependent catalytic subunit